MSIRYGPHGIAIDSQGNAWVANSWDQTDVGFSETPNEALSTRFAADSVVVFLGLAKPVRTPLIGPDKAHWCVGLQAKLHWNAERLEPLRDAVQDVRRGDFLLRDAKIACRAVVETTTKNHRTARRGKSSP